VPVPLRIERSYRVRFDEAGADGHLRSSGYLRYAQDLAWIHSESAGFGRDWYGARGLTWLARSVDLEVLDDAAYGAELNVSTEVVGFRRVWARRRSEFRLSGTERILAVAITDWVLLSAGGKPVRPPDEIIEVFPTDAADYTPLRLDLPAPAPDASRMEFVARRSELDPLGHVNNAVYVDYIDEHLAAIGRRGWLRRRPRRYLVEFLASAEPEMELTGEGWDDDNAWCYRISNSERELFRARFESDQGSWVGG
jgi:acyl-ACP thioesterase